MSASLPRLHRAKRSTERRARQPERLRRIVAGGILALATLVGRIRPAGACDICAVYIATEVAEGRTGLRLGVAEQYSRFDRLLDDGDALSTGAGEYIHSSITQFLLGWQITDRVGVQLALPFISRVYRRVEDGDRIVHGDATGLGDMTLIGNVLAYSRVTDASVLRFSVLGGIKLPTGDPDLLAEERGEPASALPAARALRGETHHDVGPSHHEPGAIPSGVHGHDLALGSGSFDGIVGALGYWDHGRVFATAGVQYAIRTEGAFDYRYADDLTWTGGPGWYALLEHEYTLGLQVLLTGETKGKDTQQGRTLDDTALTALFVGPGVAFTWGTSLGADLALDLPVVQHVTAVQIVPSFRLRGGLTWRF
ncbi:MAG: hypothetical protein KIT14_16310 [bacterium]|nr:hypothetical protein [bacterium]